MKLVCSFHLLWLLLLKLIRVARFTMKHYTQECYVRNSRWNNSYKDIVFEIHDRMTYANMLC
jgi:hypothetical protein